jgi:hypothetical protein
MSNQYSFPLLVVSVCPASRERGFCGLPVQRRRAPGGGVVLHHLPGRARIDATSHAGRHHMGGSHEPVSSLSPAGEAEKSVCARMSRRSAACCLPVLGAVRGAADMQRV